MSNPVDSSVTPFGEFQALYGTLPTAQDAKTACQQWEKLCAALLKEREQMRADLNKALVERDAFKSLYFLSEEDVLLFSKTNEEIMSDVVKDPPLEVLIAEVERNAEQNT